MSKFLTKVLLFCASGFIMLAESNINSMCVGFLDEIELPEELKDTKHLE